MRIINTYAKILLIILILNMFIGSALSWGFYEYNIASTTLSDHDSHFFQGFTVGNRGTNENFQCTGLAVYLNNTASLSSSYITVYLWNQSTPTGSGATFTDSFRILQANYTADSTWFYCPMDDGDTLSASTGYGIYIDLNDATHNCSFEIHTGNPYSGGTYWYYRGGGWSQESSKDGTFYVLGGAGVYNSTYDISNIEETTCNILLTEYADDSNNTYAALSNHTTRPYRYTFGFWWSNQTPVTQANTIGNHTIVSTWGPCNRNTQTQPVTGLQPGEYYYMQPWKKKEYADHTFDTADTAKTFLTKPQSPTNLQVVSRNATNINLKWDNATVGFNTNITTLIRYKTTGYPSSVSDGTEAYNGTGNTTQVTGLAPNKVYFFSAWTYINASGSPFYWWFSDTYETVYSGEGTANYTIDYIWECNHTHLNASEYGRSRLRNSTLWGETYTGELVFINTTLLNGPTWINHTMELLGVDLDIIFLDFNNSGMIRSLIPSSNDDPYNLTFFVCCYDEYEAGMNLSDSQVFYSFTFDDRTLNSVFEVSNQSEFHLYSSNITDTFFIHQDYWDAQDQVGVYLHYGERYQIAVKCPDMHVTFVQYIDTDSTTGKDVVIYPITEREWEVKEFVVVNHTFAGGLWLNYTDSQFGTQYVNVTIYNVTGVNITAVHWFNFTTNTDQYQWLAANENYTYYIVYNINHTLLNDNGTYDFFYLPGFGDHTIPDVDWINYQIEQVINMPDTFPITFTQLFVFILAFGILLSVGIVNASVGFIAGGVSLTMLNGLVFFESNTTTVLSILLGLTFIILGLLFFRGEMVERGGR